MNSFQNLYWWFIERIVSANFWEQFLATIIGVVLAIYIERKIAENSKQKEINKQAAFIYLELDKNLRFIRDMKNEGLPRMLNMNFWELYKEDLSKWNIRNIAQFETIYRTISRLYDMEYYSYSANDEYWRTVIVKHFTFLENEIVRLLRWYDENVNLHESLQSALDEYREIENSFEENPNNQEYIPKFHYE